MGRPDVPRDLYSLFRVSDAEPFTGVVRDIVEDPATSDWLRLALADALARDPVDAANDAETLERILTMRAEIALRSGNGLRRP